MPGEEGEILRLSQHPTLSHVCHAERSGAETKHRTPTRMEYCTDNAAMIAAAAEFLVQERGEEAYASFSTEASLGLSL